MKQCGSKELAFQEVINFIDLFFFSSLRKLTGSMFNPNGPGVKEREQFSLNQSEKAYLDTAPVNRNLLPCPGNLLNGCTLSLNAVYYIGP